MSHDVESSTCAFCHKGQMESSPEVSVVASNVREFANERFTVWRCGACASLHCREPIDGARYYARYPLKRQSRSWPARRAFERRLSWLEAAGLRPGATVLDFGCGVGLFVEHLRSRGYDATGFDPFVEGRDDASVLSGTYDVVTVQDVVEHVDAPHEMLREWLRLVRPGGLLHIGAPRAESLAPASDPSHPSLHQPFHRHIPSERALLDWARASGVDVVSTRRCWYFASRLPGLSERFLHAYVRRAGGVVDAWFDPPQMSLVLKSPRLFSAFLFGGLAESSSEMSLYFRKRADSAVGGGHPHTQRD